ncbi:MAG: Flp pilus assembly complex ATPase component TadA [Bdellovibrionales bacterium]|nr:Flp pilus assembly complex ATPase component TadA [Bdellovibrionales bacterium]
MEAKKRTLKRRPFLGQMLIELKLATEEQVKDYIERAQKLDTRMGLLMVEEGLISETDLVRAVGRQFNLDFFDLRGVKPTEEALRFIPYSVANQLTILPIKVENNILTVAVFDPLNVPKLRRLDNIIDINFEIVVSLESSIRRQIENSYLALQAKEQKKKSHLEVVEENEDIREETAVRKSLTSSSQAKKKHTSDIESLINRILEQAIGHQASDIHIEPQDNEVHVRERIDGILESGMELPLTMHAPLLSRLKIMGDLDIAEKRVPQDGRFIFSVNDTEVDFRISTLPTIRGEKAVLRILDKSNMTIGLDNLGMRKDLVTKVKDLLAHPYGIILVCGPTGSGKTTTVYSMLNHLNSSEKNIITIEDPVEYQFDVINQVQVNPKAGVSFTSILKNILRQDPDIIMIGEIRDKETAEIAVRSALTGHLVISTIHTNDAATAVNRLVDMGIDPFLISSSLLGVVAQRLVRKLCPHCKKEIHEPSDGDSPIVAEILSHTDSVYKSVGCEECYKSGYIGREGIYEVLIPDKTVRQAINEGASAQDISTMIENTGFTTMRYDGIQKAISGVTSPEEVLRGTIG